MEHATGIVRSVSSTGMTREEINQIIQAAANAHAVTVDDLTNGRNFAEIVAARSLAAGMFRDRGLKTSTIARLLQLHPTTVKKYIRRRRANVVELQREVA